MVRLGLLLAAALGLGCYTTKPVAPAPLRALHEAPVAEDAALVDGVRLDPGTRIRLQRTNGTYTPWVEARHLWLAPDGLLVAVRRVEWHDISRAELVDPSGALAEALAEQSPPPGARLERTDLGVVLEAGTARMDAWLSEALANQPAQAGARWQLEGRNAGAIPSLDDAQLRTALTYPLSVADGVRWADLHGAELNNFNGGLTFLAIGGAVVTGVTGGVALAASGAPAQSRAQVLEVRPEGARIFAASDFLPPRPERARALFSSEAIRKSRRRWLITAKAGARVPHLEGVAMTAGAGVRLWDVVELGGAVGPWWLAPYATGGVLPGDPLSPGRPARVPDWFGLLHAGLHLEVDARRRLALPLGIEAGLSTRGDVRAGIRYGVRARPLPGLWVGVLPLNATHIEGHGWSFPTSIEVVLER